MSDGKEHETSKEEHVVSDKDEQPDADSSDLTTQTEGLGEEDSSAQVSSSDGTSGEDDQDDFTLTREVLQQMLKNKEEEIENTLDRLLRAQAEYENYKKRMAREKEDLIKFGNERLMKKLLPVLDNFERSLSHAQEANTLDGIIEGIELIRKELLRTLSMFGLREITSKGEKFDPLMHEATARVPANDHPDGTVDEEFQKGYFMHDRLLRPSMVAVATAPSESGDEE